MIIRALMYSKLIINSKSSLKLGTFRLELSNLLVPLTEIMNVLIYILTFCVTTHENWPRYKLIPANDHFEKIKSRNGQNIRNPYFAIFKKNPKTDKKLLVL